MLQISTVGRPIGWTVTSAEENTKICTNTTDTFKGTAAELYQLKLTQMDDQALVKGDK